MPNYAHATLIGHLTRDPSLKTTQAGKNFVKFGLATNTGWGDNKRTTFWDATCWGPRGEALEKHFRKGDAILVSGEPSMDEWETREGEKRLTLKIDVRDWTFVGQKKEREDEDHEEPQDDNVPF